LNDTTWPTVLRRNMHQTRPGIRCYFLRQVNRCSRGVCDGRRGCHRFHRCRRGVCDGRNGCHRFPRRRLWHRRLHPPTFVHSAGSPSPHIFRSLALSALRAWAASTGCLLQWTGRGDRRHNFFVFFLLLLLSSSFSLARPDRAVCLASGVFLLFVSLGGFPPPCTCTSRRCSMGKVWHPRHHVSLIEHDYPQSRDRQSYCPRDAQALRHGDSAGAECLSSAPRGGKVSAMGASGGV